MNRIYELMFIVRPDVVEDDLDKLISGLETQVTNAGGVLKSSERMGKRRLAYMVRGFQDGMYVLFTIEGTGAVIHEAERRLRVSEPIIKFLAVRVDVEQKRMDKMKKLRDSRRRGAGTQAAAAAAAAAAAEAESAASAAAAAAVPEAGAEPAPATT